MEEVFHGITTYIKGIRSASKTIDASPRFVVICIPISKQIKKNGISFLDPEMTGIECRMINLTQFPWLSGRRGFFRY